MSEPEINIEIQQTTIQDIIGKSPGWITTWGSAIIFAFVFVLLLFASIFRFPDTVKSEITITTEYPPANLMAHASGKIQKLFVSDNQMVKAGDLLAVIDNPADYNDVIKIRQQIDSMPYETGMVNSLLTIHASNKTVQLGEIQPILSEYLSRVSEYEYFRKDNPVMQKIAALKQELEKYTELNHELVKQSNILKKELDLMQKQHERNNTLHQSGTISDADIEKSESLLLAKKYEYGQQSVEIANNKLQETRVKHEIATLEAELGETLHQKERMIKESLLNLISSVATWENKYVLSAPVDGKVSFSRIWNENQTVREGELVMSVIPENQGKIIGKLKLGMERAGKVRNGQQVIIKLHSFPYLEFGMLTGKVGSIASAPNETAYLVQIELKDSLKTTYGKIIPFKQEMLGSAEIITDELTLLTRIFNPLRHIINKHQALGRTNIHHLSD